MAFDERIFQMRPKFIEHLDHGGYVLVDLRVRRDPLGRQVLEVLADRSQGGITLDECARLSRELSGLIEAADIFESRFILDVSSPGLDRPLSTPGDFSRAKGRTVRVHLNVPVEGKLEHVGVIEEVTEQEVVVGVKTKKENKKIRIYLDQINKAKQVIL